MNPRKRAYEIFSAIVRQGKYSNLALSSMMDDATSELDRRFISALVYGTLDKLIQIDYIIKQYAKGRLQPPIHDLLRLAVYQLLYMDKVPAYSVFSETQKTAQQIGKGMLKGYINGVLREIHRNINNIQYPDKVKDPVSYFSVYYSIPEFLVKDLVQDYGLDIAEGILSHTPLAATSVRINKNKISAEEFAKKLQNLNIKFSRGALDKDVFLVTGNKIFNDNLFKSGFCSVQSQSSMLVCKIANPTPGQRILDCCSAPGGKAVYMAELMGSGSILALDIHPHRVELIKANAQRCGFSIIIEAKQQDAAEFNESFGLFDTVVVDAPCSGLGVMASKPDIKLTLTKEGLEELEQIQRNILYTAAKYVKKGGYLIYSTCTIRNAENAKQVNRFLNEHDNFKRIDIDPNQYSLPLSAVKDGMVHLLPHLHLTDGFFIAKMQKTK